MQEFDETDTKILSMLVDDARQPFSQIGEVVGLSGPAVSDRVKRLQEAGIINRFTIDIDRSTLQGGTAVLIDLNIPMDSLDEALNKVRDSNPVEHIFVTAEGEIRFYARVETENIHEWMIDLFDNVTVQSYSVDLVDNTIWTQNIDRTKLALDCVECGKVINSEGETAQIDDKFYYFCCPSCLTRFKDRYQRLAENE